MNTPPTTQYNKMPQTTDLKQLRVVSPAKINLFLHIIGKRADGYHQLQTLFQLIDLADTLTFSYQPTTAKITQPHTPFNADELITLHTTQRQVITEKPTDNLIIKAAKKLLTQIPNEKRQTLFPIHIQLEKRIPMGAGLGGGSSNAATTLVSLNRLWQLGLNQTTLLKLGQQLGADVPVFIVGQHAWGEGIGEQLYPVHLQPQTYLVLAPQCHVTTATLFNHPQLPRQTTKINKADFLNTSSIAASTFLQQDIFHNDFENLVLSRYPKVTTAMHYLTNLGLGKARLTGSGSCVFLALPTNWQQLITATQLTANAPCPAYICHSLT